MDNLQVIAEITKKINIMIYPSKETNIHVNIPNSTESFVT